MRTPMQLQYEMNKEIVGLHNDISTDRKDDVNPNEIQKSIDKFMIGWSSRLTEERTEQLEARKKEIERAHPEVGPGAALDDERARASVVLLRTNKAKDATNEFIDAMREQLLHGMKDIANEREPSMAMMIVQQMEKEQEIADKQKQLTDDPLSPQNIAKMRYRFTRKRSGQQTDRDDEH